MIEEQETSIDYVKGSKHCIVFTMEKKYIQELNRLAKEYPNEVEIRWQEVDRIEAYVPIKWFRFPKPPKRMNLTEEERAKRGARMKEGRSK